MARVNTKSLFYKLILLGAAALILALTVMGGKSISSLALDQQVRCGLPEHTHVDECYLNGVLLCERKAHIHGSNCYLVLLADNDVNWLLQAVSDTDEKSLTSVVDSTVGQALTLNENFDSATPPVTFSSGDITSLNETIEENHIVPSVTLNENLATGTQLYYALNNSGVSTLAVGDTPSNGANAINFYLMLDGEITLVSSSELTNNYPRRFSYSKTASAYQEYTITGLTTSNIGSGRTYRIRTQDHLQNGIP